MTSSDFEELFRKHFPEVLKHCQRIVQNKEDAEELAAETFVKAYLNLAKYNPKRANFRTWIFIIATNTSLDFLRSAFLKKKQKTQSLNKMVSKEDDSPDPVEQSEHHQLIQFINDCLEVLQTKQKLAVSLYYLQGFTLQEIAQIFGKNSPNTARKRIKNGAKNLKKCLENKGINKDWLKS